MFVFVPSFSLHFPDLLHFFTFPDPNFFFFCSFSRKMVAQKFVVDLNKPLVFQVKCPIPIITSCLVSISTKLAPLTLLELAFICCFGRIAGWASWGSLRWLGSRSYRKQRRSSVFPKRFPRGTYIILFRRIIIIM